MSDNETPTPGPVPAAVAAESTIPGFFPIVPLALAWPIGELVGAALPRSDRNLQFLVGVAYRAGAGDRAMILDIGGLLLLFYRTRQEGEDEGPV